MEALSDFWNIINDKSWPLLDALHIGDFFDEHGIPPVLFPIGIAVIIIILLLTFTHGGPQDVCGDGKCSLSELESGMCPEDCEIPEEGGPAGNRVIVKLDRTPSCEIIVKLYSQSNEFLTSQRAVGDQFVFDGIDQESVYVEILGPSSQSQRTPATSVQEGETTISVTLSQTICETQQPQIGVLRLTVKDSSTGTSLNDVTVSISEVENGFPVNRVITNAIVNGFRDFSLPSGKPYVIYAEKTGYEGYDGSGDPVMVPATAPVSKVISLTPQAIEPGSPDIGDLEVCVMNGTEPVLTGNIVVEGVSDTTFLLVGDLSDVSPVDEPSAQGCYVFKDIPAGKLVTAAMPNAPEGCIPTASPSSVEIIAGGRQIIVLNLNCQPSDVAYLRIKVMSEDNRVLTQNATITLWTEDSNIIPGSGLGSSLAMGSGGYTEEVTVPSDKSVYAWVRGLPIGYLDYRSDPIDLSSGEHKSLTIYLNYTQPTVSSQDFVFSGIAAPSYVPAGQQFQATVNKITFGQTVLTGSTATLTATIGNMECSVMYDSVWRAACIAPNTTGNYELVFSVNYDGKTGTESVPVEVRKYASGFGMITITPLFSTHEDPPLRLYYDIQFNGRPVEDIAGQRLEVIYRDSPRAYAGEVSSLTRENEYWTLDANVPFKGDYMLKMYIEVLENGTYYNTSYIATFTAKSNSDGLSADVYISKRILNVLESFDVEVTLSFEGTPIKEFRLLELRAGDVIHSMPWVRAKHLYALQVAAPQHETCMFDMDLLIKGEPITKKERAYVIDTSKTKSALCPLERQASCDSIEDVRSCIHKQETGEAYFQEQQLLACITAACGYALPPTCPSTNKGDLLVDCLLDEEDITLAEEFLNVVKSQRDRNLFVPCMDMDNDGDVDTDDLTCMRNVVSTKWYGDRGEEGSLGGICPGLMHGGFCFDIDTDAALPGDLKMDGRINRDDEVIMNKIISAADAGVTPHADILSVADFNADGVLDQTDLDCLKNFYAINFNTGEVAKTTSQIPLECFGIFNLQCTGTKGDMNADGEITDVDYIIVQFIANGQLAGCPEEIRICADINSDGIVNEDDILCIQSFLTGDRQDWLICLDCEKNMPPAAYGQEICGDGFDNDCDGIKDPQDICQCNSHTPCDMKKDADGGARPGIDDGNYRVCRDLSWDQMGYRWVSRGEISCTSSRQCETIACEGDERICSSVDGSKGKWYRRDELPRERCGDGWDNDCVGGDKQCSTDDEEDSGCPLGW